MLTASILNYTFSYSFPFNLYQNNGVYKLVKLIFKKVLNNFLFCYPASYLFKYMLGRLVGGKLFFYNNK